MEIGLTTHRKGLCTGTAKTVLQYDIYLERIAVYWYIQGSHRLEKYLNLEGFLEKSLKIKSATKSTGKSLKTLKIP